ncbi:hypothetical protein J6E39_01835 [bacterium]|nr:hypothetical protein [bacterium]
MWNNIVHFIISINWIKIIEIIIPVVVSIVSIFYARMIEKQKIIDEEIRQQKVKIYGEFTQLVFEEVIGRNGKNMNMDKIKKFFPKFFEKLIFWGADSVVKQFSIYMSAIYNIDDTNYNNNPEETMLKLENLLYAIRRDTGHKNKNLEQKDLLRLFIKDIDKRDKN